MCEPLRGKNWDFVNDGYEAWITKTDYSDSIDHDTEIFLKSDVKSAVVGIINYHEDIIEDFIINLESVVWSDKYRQIIVDMIGIQYDAIMNIEHWLEDVIE